MTGIWFYVGLALFDLSGFPLAVLTILTNPTLAGMTRADFHCSQEHLETMFFGARTVPLQLTIALAGVFFAYLLSALGKDIGAPPGI